MKVLHECLDNDSPHLICKHCGAVGRCEKDDPPMPPQTKALALALAILREHNAWHIAQDKDGSYDDSGLQEQTLAAIHALEQEAAQPVQAAPDGKLLEAWHRWYNQIDVLQRNPLPVPPAGDVQALEDLDDAIRCCPVPVAAPVSAEDAPEITDAMVDAYLRANDAYWREVDALPLPVGRWRDGTPKEATRVSLRAALAAKGEKT